MVGPVSMRDRLGGQWAFSWRASLTGSALISLLIVIRGSSLSGESPSVAGITSWVGVAAVAVAVKSIWQWTADKTVINERRRKTLSITRVLTFYLISGALFGAALVLAELIIRPTGSTAAISDGVVRAFALAAATVCWYVITTVLFDARERFWSERTELLDQLVAAQLSQIREDQILEELRGKVREELEQPVNQARLLTASALLEGDGASQSAVPEQLRDLATSSVRSLSHELMDEDKRHYSQGRLRDIWKTFALEIRFATGFVIILIALAYAIDTAVRNELQVGLLSTSLFAAIGAACMGTANRVMDRVPRFRLPIYAITFVLLLLMTLLYVSGATLTGIAQIGFESLAMSWAEVGFLILLSAIGLLGTSYASAVLLNRQQLLDRLRMDTDLALAQEIATAQRLAAATRRLGSELHGSLQTRLVVCAGAIDSSLTNHDSEGLREALQQAWDVLKMPLDSRVEIGSVQQVLDRHTKVWAGLLEIRCAVDSTISSPSFAIATSVDVVLEEGLANAYRHAGASRVDVSINIHDQGGVVRMRDNGTGLGEVTPGVGSQRMASVGEVDLSSDSDGRTVLTVTMNAPSQ